MKKLVYTIVLIGFSCAFAGSYDDFFRAVVSNDTRRIERLVERGFDPNARDPNGHPALIRALRADSSHSALTLARLPGLDLEAMNRAGETALMMAALKGDLAVCEVLIKRGAAIDRDGWTPLHYAASGNSLPALQMLLANGARVDARAPNGRTPLMLAASYAGEPVIDALLAAGADPTARDASGVGAAQLAEGSGRDWLARKLGG